MCVRACVCACVNRPHRPKFLSVKPVTIAPPSTMSDSDIDDLEDLIGDMGAMYGDKDKKKGTPKEK